MRHRPAWVLGFLAAFSGLAVSAVPASQARRGGPSENPGQKRLVSWAELVGPNDPLAVQDLQFDARFAADALTYKARGDPGILEEMAKSPAAAHLLNHARHFDYDVPTLSSADLVHFLMKPGNSESHWADVGRAL